jgi:HK97 family phage major capsid protein
VSTQSTQLRDEAFSLTKQAQVALDEGNIDQATGLSQDAENKIAQAEKMDSVESQIRVLQADQRDLDSSRTETMPSEAEAIIGKVEETRKGKKYDPNYKPEHYIKNLPAAAQPKYVMDHVGENVLAEAQAYEDAFRIWTSKATNEEFNREAPEWAQKQMVEGTDADGGFYVPENFLARNIELYQGVPGGNLRDHATTLRVSGKDGYMPAMNSVTWAAMTEATAPGAVKPTISQISYSLEKSGSLIQISDELLADEAMNIPDLLAGACRKAAGQYQNIKLLNGSGAWGGVMTGAVGVTQYAFAGATAITAADLTALYYQIDADYRDSTDAIFISRSAVASAVAAIGSTSAGVHQLSSLTDSPSEYLLGKRYLQDDNTGNGLDSAITTGKITFVFGDWSWIYLFERAGFSVSRNDSVYWDSGMVGFKFSYRMGSATSNTSAFIIGKQA